MSRFRKSALVSSVVLGLSCATATQRAEAPAEVNDGCCGKPVLDRGLDLATRYRVSAIATRRFTHEQFWAAVQPSLGVSSLRVTRLGQSLQGREIRAVTFGHGPVRVLLWSQMHGDEATATMALADIFRFLAGATNDDLRERLAGALTVVFIPMLNPDGAELFQRENAAGIDVNRDARQLATPEGRILKRVRDSLLPEFGFNLHDQNARMVAGNAGSQVAIALLAPAYDEARSWNPVRSRARQVAAVIAGSLGHEIPGRIAKYDDGFAPRAFGDLMQQWGTSTVLIESGALPGDPDKQRLRVLNGAALLVALDAIATESYLRADPWLYDGLPPNTSGASDLLIRGGHLVYRDTVLRADVAINYDDPVARKGAKLRDVGDLREMVALDTIDATGLFVHPGSMSSLDRSAFWLRLGSQAGFMIRRGPTTGSELVRTVN